MALKLLKGADLNNQRLINLADPTGNTDGATKQYVDALTRGLDWKASVRVAPTANVAVASALIAGAVFDGVTLATGDRILLMNQTAGAENGIYTAVASGAAPRAVDANTSALVTSGMAATVTEGTVNGDKVFIVTTNDPLTLGTTALAFTQLGGATGTTYTAGGGLSLTGSTFAVIAGNGIIADVTSTRVDPAIVVRKFAADCVVTTNPQTFTHGLATTDVTVAVWEAGTTYVIPDITKSTTVSVTVDWGAAPTAAQYRVVVHG